MSDRCTFESIQRKLNMLESQCGVCSGVVKYRMEYRSTVEVPEYHLKYWSITWSIEVSFGVPEY